MKIVGHRLFGNAAALAVVQLSNFAPILIIPFLTRRLGVDLYGVVAIILSTIQLAFVLTDYGFSLSATYDISRSIEKKHKVNGIVSSVFLAKIPLVIFSCVIAISIPIFIEPYKHYTAIFAAALLAIVAQAYQPIWFFQGIEKMAGITIYMVSTKILYLLAILLLVHDEADAGMVIWSWGIAQLIGAVIGIYFIYKNGYKIEGANFKQAWDQLRNATPFFWSRLAVAIYTSAATPLVGLAGAAEAGRFFVCQQVYKAGQNVMVPINQALYPYMAKERDWKIFGKIVVWCGLAMVVGCSILAYISKDFLRLIFGTEYISAAPILWVFLLANVVNYFAVIFGYPAFAALKKVNIANYSVIAGAIAYVLFLFVQKIFDNITAINVALSILFAEVVVLIVRGYFLANEIEVLKRNEKVR